MERLLDKKVCIITGTAQGIGKKIAEQFSAVLRTISRAL